MNEKCLLLFPLFLLLFFNFLPGTDWLLHALVENLYDAPNSCSWQWQWQPTKPERKKWNKKQVTLNTAQCVRLHTQRKRVEKERKRMAGGGLYIIVQCVSVDYPSFVIVYPEIKAAEVYTVCFWDSTSFIIYSEIKCVSLDSPSFISLPYWTLKLLPLMNKFPSFIYPTELSRTVKLKNLCSF